MPTQFTGTSLSQVSPELIQALIKAGNSIGINTLYASSGKRATGSLAKSGYPSRHGYGRAIDISMIDDQSVQTPEGQKKADALVSQLKRMGFSMGESGNARSIIWRAPGHWNHIHVGWKPGGVNMTPADGSQSPEIKIMPIGKGIGGAPSPSTIRQGMNQSWQSLRSSPYMEALMGTLDDSIMPNTNIESKEQFIERFKRLFNPENIKLYNPLEPTTITSTVPLAAEMQGQPGFPIRTPGMPGVPQPTRTVTTEVPSLQSQRNQALQDAAGKPGQLDFLLASLADKPTAVRDYLSKTPIPQMAIATPGAYPTHTLLAPPQNKQVTGEDIPIVPAIFAALGGVIDPQMAGQYASTVLQSGIAKADEEYKKSLENYKYNQAVRDQEFQDAVARRADEMNLDQGNREILYKNALAEYTRGRDAAAAQDEVAATQTYYEKLSKLVGPDQAASIAQARADALTRTMQERLASNAATIQGADKLAALAARIYEAQQAQEARQSMAREAIASRMYEGNLNREVRQSEGAANREFRGSEGDLNRDLRRSEGYQSRASREWMFLTKEERMRDAMAYLQEHRNNMVSIARARLDDADERLRLAGLKQDAHYLYLKNTLAARQKQYDDLVSAFSKTMEFQTSGGFTRPQLDKLNTVIRGIAESLKAIQNYTPTTPVPSSNYNVPPATMPITSRTTDKAIQKALNSRGSNLGQFPIYRGARSGSQGGK